MARTKQRVRAHVKSGRIGPPTGEHTNDVNGRLPRKLVPLRPRAKVKFPRARELESDSEDSASDSAELPEQEQQNSESEASISNAEPEEVEHASSEADPMEEADLALQDNDPYYGEFFYRGEDGTIYRPDGTIRSDSDAEELRELGLAVQPEDLMPARADTGMSYEERVEKREAPTTAPPEERPAGRKYKARARPPPGDLRRGRALGNLGGIHAVTWSSDEGEVPETTLPAPAEQEEEQLSPLSGPEDDHPVFHVTRRRLVTKVANPRPATCAYGGCYLLSENAGSNPVCKRHVNVLLHGRSYISRQKDRENPAHSDDADLPTGKGFNSLLWVHGRFRKMFKRPPTWKRVLKYWLAHRAELVDTEAL